MTYRILCFGGRKFTDAARVNSALDMLMEHHPMLRGAAIVHGGAAGADTLAGAWGRANGHCVIRVDANWNFYQLKAGAIQNGWMLEFCMPTYAVGFPGGTGTANMLAKLAAVPLKPWIPYAE